MPKVTDLPNVGTLTDGDVLPIVDSEGLSGARSKQVAVSQIKDYVLTSADARYADKSETAEALASKAAQADVDSALSLKADNTFTQDGDGAVERTKDDKLREQVHLFDFIPPSLQSEILLRTSTTDVTSYINAATAVLSEWRWRAYFPCWPCHCCGHSDPPESHIPGRCLRCYAHQSACECQSGRVCR
jgi:hypothetical protein